MKKKVCLVTGELSILGRSGGIGGAFVELALVLSKTNDVSILYCPNTPISRADEEALTSFFNMSSCDFYISRPHLYVYDLTSPMGRSYSAYMELRDIGINFDAIHFHDYGGIGFYALLARDQGIAFRDTTIIVQLHGPTRWTLEANQSTFISTDQLRVDFMERATIARADHIVSPSNYLLDWVRQKNWNLPPENRCHVIKNVSSSLSTMSRDVLDDKTIHIDEIIFFGRHERRKGIEIFSDALSLLNGELSSRSIRVTFIGGFSEFDSMHTGVYLIYKSRNWNFPISIYTKFDRQKSIDYLKNAHKSLVVIASPVENSPYTVSEAACIGRPVITSSGGGAKELLSVDSHNESICDMNSKDLFAHLSRAISNGVHPPKIAELSSTTANKWIDFHDRISKKKIQIHDIKEIEKLPLVSFCITHYERPEKLFDAVYSALRQTYDNLEIIVVDDGSVSEKTLNELKKIETLLGRCGGKIIYRENGYLGAARNTAVEHASGEYVVFLDDDDIAMPELVETLVLAATNTDADIVNCFNIYMPLSRRHEAWINPENFSAKISYLPLGDLISLAPVENPFGSATALLNRQMLSQIGGYTELRGVGYEDYELFLRAAQNNFKIEICPVPLYLYEVGRVSMANNTSPMRNFKRILDHIDIQSSPDAYYDFLSLSIGMHAVERAKTFRHSIPSKGAEKKYVEALEKTSDTNSQLKILSKLAAHVGAHAIETAFRNSVLDDASFKQKYKFGDHAPDKENSYEDGIASYIHRDIVGYINRDISMERDEETSCRRIMSKIKERGTLNIEEIKALISYVEIIELDSLAEEMLEVLYNVKIFETEKPLLHVISMVLSLKAGNKEGMRKHWYALTEIESGEYVEANSDVRDAVNNGGFRYGFDHFVEFGEIEGRSGFSWTNRLRSMLRKYISAELSYVEIQRILESSDDSDDFRTLRSDKLDTMN